jgi:hypothetical protein
MGYRPAAMTWSYLIVSGVLAVVEWVLFFSRALAVSHDVVVAVMDVFRVLIYCPLLIGVVWIYMSWSRVGDSPAGALGRFFIPGYNLYWMFACPQQLCSSIDGALVDAGQPAGAPRSLAAVAPTLQLALTFVGFTEAKGYLLLVSPTAHVLWGAFMVLCDRAVVRALAKGRAEG